MRKATRWIRVVLAVFVAGLTALGSIVIQGCTGKGKTKDTTGHTDRDKTKPPQEPMICDPVHPTPQPAQPPAQPPKPESNK